MRRTATRWVARVVTVVLAGSLLAAAPPASAATRVTPGDFTGFAFDACDTPTSAQMERWRRTSPYWGVGVYLGGTSVASHCDRSALTEAWVTRQSRRGWRVLPIWVGPQASCTGYASRIDASRGDSYAAAARQGRLNASAAVRAAGELGIARRSTLWYDLEDFDLAGDDCRRSALTFLSAWTKRLHALGYTSGVYSSVASGIHALDNADRLSPGSYAMPDQVWYAWENGRADTFVPTKWVRSSSWLPRRRMHQFDLDTTATHGGVELFIDRNFLSLGRGSVAPKALSPCGVSVTFGDYRLLRRGATGPQVKAAQCLLKRQRVYSGKVHGRYDVATVRAARKFQAGRGIRTTGTTTLPTWTALLVSGTGPVVKRGSVGDPVRRVQRALTAALDRKVAASGVFTAGTTGAVRAYQRSRGLPATGVVAPDTWAELRAGHR